MRIGVCCGFDQAGFALESGADFVEVPGWRLADGAAKCEGAEVCNLFFPDGFLLYADQAATLDHARRVLDSAEAMGLSVAVVGSGRQRKCPPTWTTEDARKCFVNLMAQTGDLARERGIRLAPESLRASETDVFNDMRSLAWQMETVGVGVTADTYHLLGEEGRDWPKQIPLCPVHVHLSCIQRRAPLADDEEVGGILKWLKRQGYAARISLECRWDDFEAELPQALANARQLWENA